MKRIIIHIGFAVVAVIFLMASCTTSQTITIKGTPGTNIYTPSNNLLGSIDQKGEIKVKLESDNYYAFLLSQKQGSQELVPFALDYKSCNYMLDRSLYGLFAVIDCAGLGAALGGLFANGDTRANLFVGGSAAVLAASAYLLPAEYRLGQTQQAYRFKYLSYQSTNDDLSFVRPVLSGEARREVGSNRESALPNSDNDENSSSARSRNLSERSSRTLNSLSKDVEGEFVCSGKLLLGRETVEEYTKAKVIIKSVDKTTVSVEVLDDNGEPFFNNPSIYVVKKNRQNNYTLTHQTISSATITIINGKLSYSHPRVNIDGDIYKLTINGSK